MVERKRKYVDVNVFVYWLTQSEFTERAKKWIQRIENSRFGEFCTSSLTIYEVAVIISGLTGKGLKDSEFVGMIIEAFTSLKQLFIIPLEKEDLYNAFFAMKKYNLDMEDAIHYTIAKKVGAETIISNDKDFDNTSIKRQF